MNTTADLDMTDNASPRRILIATLVAFVVASILLITVILPAEFNRDPLGTGKLLGITGMSETQTVGVLNPQAVEYHRDSFTIVLASYESIEYKYRLEEGATMLFEWEAESPLLFDMHAEQDGRDPAEFSPSFDQRESRAEKGSYTAPFSGIHGWYWENRSPNDVRLELNTAGFYSKAIEFRQNYHNEKTF